MIIEMYLLPKRITMVFLQKPNSFYLEVIDFCLLKTNYCSSKYVERIPFVFTGEIFKSPLWMSVFLKIKKLFLPLLL